MEGSKYFHDLYLKAVNHPVRREILTVLSEKEELSRSFLIKHLLEKKLIQDENMFQYNIEYLIKALCVELKKPIERNEKVYVITQGGKVIDYLDK
jgi:DNA-binding transcriptional ArsR family regulator